MPQPSVTPDVHEPLDIDTRFLPQVTFDLVIPLQNISDLRYFLFGKRVSPCIGINLGFGKNPVGERSSHTIYVCQRYLYSFFPRYINTSNSCHSLPP